jgi:hypothetical protein
MPQTHPLTADWSYINPLDVDLVLNEMASPSVDPSGFTAEHLSRVADYVTKLEGELADARRLLTVAQQTIAAIAIREAMQLAMARRTFAAVAATVEGRAL